MFLTAFHSLVHLLPWFAAAVTPSAAARVGSRGIEAVLEYIKQATFLFDFVLAGGIVTARLVTRKKWRDRNAEFEVAIRQLYDPRLRILCRRLLALVQQICASSLSTKWLPAFAARRLSRHDSMAIEGTKRSQQIVRHIVFVRLMALRFG